MGRLLLIFHLPPFLPFSLFSSSRARSRSLTHACSIIIIVAALAYSRSRRVVAAPRVFLRLVSLHLLSSASCIIRHRWIQRRRRPRHRLGRGGLGGGGVRRESTGGSAAARKPRYTAVARERRSRCRGGSRKSGPPGGWTFYAPLCRSMAAPRCLVGSFPSETAVRAAPHVGVPSLPSVVGRSCAGPSGLSCAPVGRRTGGCGPPATLDPAGWPTRFRASGWRW